MQGRRADRDRKEAVRLGGVPGEVTGCRVDCELADVVAGILVGGLEQHVVADVFIVDEGIQQQERLAGEALACGATELDGLADFVDADPAQVVLVVLFPDDAGHAEPGGDGDAGHLLDGRVGDRAGVGGEGVGPGVGAFTERRGVTPPEEGGRCDDLRQLGDLEGHRGRQIVRIVVRELAGRPRAHLVALRVDDHEGPDDGGSAVGRGHDQHAIGGLSLGERVGQGCEGFGGGAVDRGLERPAVRRARPDRVPMVFLHGHRRRVDPVDLVRDHPR
jgi:hypothetical protein